MAKEIKLGTHLFHRSLYNKTAHYDAMSRRLHYFQRELLVPYNRYHTMIISVVNRGVFQKSRRIRAHQGASGRIRIRLRMRLLKLLSNLLLVLFKNAWGRKLKRTRQ